MSSPLSKDQEKLRGRDVRTMSNEHLVLWLDACEKMISSVPHKNGRKGWKESKALAESILIKRKNTEPNQAPQTTICTVTECAPSRTFRASADRV
jgi:hypothetical protein